MRADPAGPSPFALCIDIGKSGARGWLTGPGVDLVGRAKGIEPESAGRPGSAGRLLGVVEALWDQLAPTAGGPTDSDLGKLVLGSTSIPADPDVHVFLDRARARWSNASIALADDGLLGHAAAVGGPGTYVSVGTGVIAYGLDREGLWRRKDGWGPDLGDRGGALWLGSAGLFEALRAADGAGPPTTLLEEARRYLGGADHAAAVRLAGRVDRVAVLSGFARTVCALAPTDRLASDLVERAAAMVYETAAAMVRATQVQGMYVGGQLACNDVYWQALEKRCSDEGIPCSRSDTAPWKADPALIFSAVYAAACAGIRSS